MKYKKVVRLYSNSRVAKYYRATNRNKNNDYPHVVVMQYTFAPKKLYKGQCIHKGGTVLCIY